MTVLPELCEQVENGERKGLDLRTGVKTPCYPGSMVEHALGRIWVKIGSHGPSC
jgi:hypothetical protein